MSGIAVITAYQKWASSLTDGFHNINSEMFVVGISANVTRDDLSGACMKGVHFILKKPVKFEQLIAVLKTKKQSTSLKDARETLAHSAEFIDVGEDISSKDGEGHNGVGRGKLEKEGDVLRDSRKKRNSWISYASKTDDATSDTDKTSRSSWDFRSMWAHIPSPSEFLGYTRRAPGNTRGSISSL